MNYLKEYMIERFFKVVYVNVLKDSQLVVKLLKLVNFLFIHLRQLFLLEFLFLLA
jgi:hypothetical protein